MVGRTRDRVEGLLAGLEGEDAGDHLDDNVRASGGAREGISEQVSGLSALDVSVSDLSSDPGDPAGASRPNQARGRMMSELESTYKRRIATLEDRVLDLLNRKRTAEEERDGEVARRDAQIVALRQQLEQEVRQLKLRQTELDAQGPSMRAQLAAARSQLKDLAISDAMYQELCKIDPEDRLLPDAVKVAVYEALQELRADNERLRRCAAVDRETADRVQEDLARAQRDRDRALARAAERERDAAAEVAGMRARLERYEHEMEEAVVRSQVLSAKAAAYDEVKAELDATAKAHRDAQARLAGAEAARAEAERVRAEHAEREHALQLLSVDKAYLTQQSEALARQVAQLEERLAQRESKIEDLKRARGDLQSRLLEGERDSAAAVAARVEGEVARIREESRREVERIRAEGADAYAREAGVLRDMRDGAVAEGERLRAQVRDAEAARDEALVALRDAQRARDVQTTELRGQLHVRALELERARADADERGSVAATLRAENDMLHEKVRVLQDSFHRADAEHNLKVQDMTARLQHAEERLAHYDLLESHVDEAIIGAGAEGPAAGEDAALRALEGAVPTAVRRRVKQALELAARCSKLEATRAALERERDELRGKVRELTVATEAAARREERRGAPEGYLVRCLDEAEERAARAEARCEALEGEVAAAGAERDRMRADLSGLLSDRGAMEQLKDALLEARAARKAAAAAPGRGEVAPRTPGSTGRRSEFGVRTPRTTGPGAGRTHARGRAGTVRATPGAITIR
ncbi:unnamed protein product [Pedinophyceae sp. YPF-701]|nr:unnamed protein product [Pedinophyceae sp. YPF-701]